MNEGGLIMAGISGTILTKEEKDFIKNEKICGVILFSRNYESPLQLAELTNNIQSLRDEYPLYIAVDQEGGRVQRLKKDFLHFPAMQLIAKRNSPKVVYEVYKIMAEQLTAVGVNLDFAPCCDVLINPENQVIGDRAFGNDSLVVEKYVTSAVRGLQANGVLGCAKHFPGHGSTREDSHEELPLVSRSLELMEKEEWGPFIKAIKSRVEFLMVAHLLVPAFDEQNPCSLSSKVYQFIREHLNFNKIIITDDMQMKAITDKYSVAHAAVKAVSAGADMLLYRDLSEAQKGLDAIRKALKFDELENQQVQLKIKKMMLNRKKNFSNYRPIELDKIQNKLHNESTREFHRKMLKMIELKS